MLAIAKLTVGDGYEYLSRQVATGDIEISRSQALAAYYAASGTEPGVWLGRGLDGLAEVRRGDRVATTVRITRAARIALAREMKLLEQLAHQVLAKPTGPVRRGALPGTA